MFGVKRGGARPAAAQAEGRAVFTADQGECRLSGVAYDVSVAEKDLAVEQGKPLGAHGATPLAVVHRAGKGAAVFLNVFMDAYPQRRALGIEEPLRRVAEGVLLVRGVRPVVGVSIEATPKAYALLNRFGMGGATIVTGVMNWDGKAADWSASITLDLPKTGHVYDLRKGAWVGETNRVKAALLSGDAVVYAVLPAKVTGIKAYASPAEVRAGGTVAVTVQVEATAAPAWRHAIRVEVKGPDGASVPHYSGVIAAERGKGQWRLNLALNDAPGRWTVTAQDVVSGQKGQAAFVVGRP